MTPADSYLLLCSGIILIACPLAFMAGALCGGKRKPASKCCACGKACPGMKCDQCAEFSER